MIHRKFITIHHEKVKFLSESVLKSNQRYIILTFQK
jgi:hypothetical protein